MKKIYTVIYCIGFASTLFAQDGLGSWNLINVSLKWNDTWGAFGEAQLRSLRLYDDFHYHEMKGGINWNGIKNVRLTMAGGRYVTYAEGGDFVRPKNNDEIRLWPQIILFQNAGRLRIEQRYRAEFRFTSDGYRNRFRYRLGLTYPVSRKNTAPALYVNNELFFTDREPYFERNRFATGVNIRVSAYSSLQVGYLYQFDYRINDETGKRFFQIGWLIELKRKQATSREVNSTDN